MDFYASLRATRDAIAAAPSRADKVRAYGAACSDWILTGAASVDPLERIRCLVAPTLSLEQWAEIDKGDTLSLEMVRDAWTGAALYSDAYGLFGHPSVVKLEDLANAAWTLDALRDGVTSDAVATRAIVDQIGATVREAFDAYCEREGISDELEQYDVAVEALKETREDVDGWGLEPIGFLFG